MTVYRSFEIVATSEKSWSDAVREGYLEAKKTLHGIRNIEIIKSDVKVKEDSDLLIYRVRMQITFELERSEHKEEAKTEVKPAVKASKPK
jgi:flavin-binding protein dodecin